MKRLALSFAVAASLSLAATGCSSTPDAEPEVATEAAGAEDWPGFRGANRQGRSGETGLLRQWPDDGPAKLWAAAGLGAGHSSPVIVGGHVYVAGLLEETGYLFAFDGEGKPLWKVPYGAEDPKVQFPGPRATPTVAGDRVYMTSSGGRLVCVEGKDGAEVWAVELLERFGVEKKKGSWGVCESVLVDGDHVIVCPGGDVAMAALDRSTGATVWKTEGADLPASYSSPALMKRAGRTIVIAVLDGAIVGVDRADGKLLWQHPFKSKASEACVSPVIEGDLVFTAARRTGGTVIEVAADGTTATEKWITPGKFDIRIGGAVCVDGHLYGTGTHQRVRLVCVEMATGDVVWQAADIEEGSVIAADGLIFWYRPRDAEIAMLRADPTGPKLGGRFVIGEESKGHYSHLAISDGRLYVRHGEQLLCFDVRGK